MFPGEVYLKNSILLSCAHVTGDTIYQFELTSPKPCITPCNDISCWSSKAITEHYGDWAPASPDTVFNHNGIVLFMRGNMIYQATDSAKHIHDIFPKMPCGVTAVDRLRRYPSNLVYKGNKIFYLTPTWLDSFDETCFKWTLSQSEQWAYKV